MANVSIEFYGLLVEIVGKKILTLENINNTDDLRVQLENLFPKMKGQEYIIAINNKIASTNSKIENNQTVACMPPFAGG